ncbi:MAG: PD-(D/E)XK nuclease family protein [Planctomycetes bacterium]|nr:PD-(D/E)XK nuclease family protein [Planctomycetota bacterium]
MASIFSHIVQKRLSQEKENVATEALTFILRSKEQARAGLMKLLRGIAPELPTLQFRTQLAEGIARPDMWGFDATATPRVFIENKFWAGLTENQPVQYLKLLSAHAAPTLLLVVVPAGRLETVWRELRRRLTEANFPLSTCSPSQGVYRTGSVNFGSEAGTAPWLAITSWSNVLSAVEAGLADEPQARNDLFQLLDLCDAADNDGAAPFASTQLTDQSTPSFILRLSSVIQQAVNLGVSEGVLSIDGLRPTSSWDRIGRYIRFPNGGKVEPWIGTDLRKWRDRGTTPLWLVFSTTKYGRGAEVRAALESWVEQNQIVICDDDDGSFAVGIEVVAGEEPDHVVRAIVNRLREIVVELSRLPVRATGEL